MKKTTIAIIILSILLVASNIWWAYHYVSFGLANAYILDSYERRGKALNQTLLLLPVVAQSNISRDKIINAACLPNDKVEPFEKEGYIWVGEIGLKFNKENKLVEARTSWSQ